MLINKRKLIQLFLSELYGERQYLEFKAQVDLDSVRGKASVAKAICGLANGNRNNRSYVVFGIENETKTVCGNEPIDDQQFQQLVRNFLDPAPPILYENVVLAGAESSVVGLLTIYPSPEKVSFSRDIWKIKKGDVFQRVGSETSRENAEAMAVIDHQEELLALESKAATSLETILQDVVEFHSDTPVEYQPRFLVFHDRHTVCYSGYPETESIESESWAILAGEGVKIFWGALQYVKFSNTEDSFSITEHIPLFWKKERILVPFEENKFRFFPDGRYCQERHFVFTPPSVPKSEIDELLESYHKDLTAYRSMAYESQDKFPRFEIYSHELLVAAVNGDVMARQYLLEYLDGHADGIVGESSSEAMRFLERIEAA